MSHAHAENEAHVQSRWHARSPFYGRQIVLLWRTAQRSARSRAQPRKDGKTYESAAIASGSIKTVVVRQAAELPPRPDTPFLGEDGVDGGLGEEIGIDAPWQSVDVPEQAVEALVTEEPSLRELTAVAHDAGTPGTEPLILQYLQEAGRVPLLTAADEVRLAEQLHTAKAHLLAALQAVLPTAPIPTELTPEARLAERLRQAFCRRRLHSFREH
jgi:hypothetical protein